MKKTGLTQKIRDALTNATTYLTAKEIMSMAKIGKEDNTSVSATLSGMEKRGEVTKMKNKREDEGKKLFCYRLSSQVPKSDRKEIVQEEKKIKKEIKKKEKKIKKEPTKLNIDSAEILSKMSELDALIEKLIKVKILTMLDKKVG